ncbi:hypothetical protein B0H14DRAFT_3604276 [Mycena olivaceomarginata]|nr:hypothetical protein B0H14DRAFT_3604276 [Mycena olivaceomarginata]
MISSRKALFPFSSLARTSSLLTSIELPCRPENLNKSKLAWKPKKPKNAEKLPLASDKGYKAMVTEMKEKTVNNHVVLLYMPAPMKPMEEEMQLWDTNEEPMPTFDYSELEPAGAGTYSNSCCRQSAQVTEPLSFTIASRFGTSPNNDGYKRSTRAGSLGAALHTLQPKHGDGVAKRYIGAN